MRPSASWAIDSEPIKAQRIIVKCSPPKTRCYQQWQNHPNLASNTRGYPLCLVGGGWGGGVAVKGTPIVLIETMASTKIFEHDILFFRAEGVFYLVNSSISSQ